MSWLTALVLVANPSAGAAQSAKDSEGFEQATSSLAHAIQDDNYLEALTRFHAAVPRWSNRSGSFHLHADLRMIDLHGRESKATVDRWLSGRVGRDESSAPGWHRTIIWGLDRSWSSQAGIAPMRLPEFEDLASRPNPMERRIRIMARGYVTLKPRKIEGVIRDCSGNIGGAMICFDSGSGFPALASLDDERVVYETWGSYDGASFPSRWAVYRGRRLQMEASVTITALDGDATLFQALPGIASRPNRFGVPWDEPHAVLTPGIVDSSVYGQALVRVFVDSKGHVSRVELLDAGHSVLGTAAMAAAWKTIYMSKQDDGRGVPFETALRIDHWSTLDPLAVEATSLRSQGTD